MIPTGLEKQATELGLLLAPDYTSEWISSGTQGKQLMIKKTGGAPVLCVRKNTKSWGLYRPPSTNSIKDAADIKLLTEAVCKELGIRQS
jgi:hypothetical protein